MTTATLERRAPTSREGLVVMLDVAGHTIAALELRVEQLEDTLVLEREERGRVEAMLDDLRRHMGREATGLDTPSVDPSSPQGTDTRGHDRPATEVPATP